ncbi:MAG TPA: Nif3-like dinuclear metal center hexameric protein, partial [Planctomycetota bacterium]|nr:Nif3-like dinuclear metal center hexameric protein [Planctomycetota bacterium]
MAVSLAQALAALDGIAPLRYAESWDNVGLLVEPRPTRGRAAGVGRILLAIDATEAVVAEAVRRRCALLVAYHPP